MAKRGNGLGSVYQRSDGRWVAQLSAGYGSDGKRQRWITYHRTKAAAEEALKKAIKDQLGGTLVVNERTKVGEYLTQWLEMIEPTLRPKTAAWYRTYVEKAFPPAFQKLKLTQLNIPTCQKLVAGWQREGRSPRWMQAARGVLRSALNDAVKWELIGTNPAAHVEVPRVPKREYTTWTDAQLQTFIRAVEDDPLDGALFIIAILTGARAGELLALEWGDIDLERGTLSIRRAVTHVTGQGLVVSEPKTASSRRTISLDTLAIETLKRQRQRIELSSPLVFPGERGQLRGVSAIRLKLQKLCRELKLPVLRFHDLRHQSATMLLAAGENPKDVQARLGHSSFSVTMDIYAHVTQGRDRGMAERLGARLRGKQSG